MFPVRLSCALSCLVLLAACGSDTRLSDAPICDGVLNSAEEAVDDAFDQDGDGFFDGLDEDCRATYDAANLDCDDSNASAHPGAAEATCNGWDDDCDDGTPDAPDADADGRTPCDGDCDDGQPLVGPGAAETACDGLDNDCDPASPDAVDADADTWGDCEDCDDGDASVNPASPEVACNGADDDCNSATPDGADLDGDGMIHCFDCDDADPLRYPGAVEICEDGIDQDCDTADAPCAPPSWSGIWDTGAVSYSCATGKVDIAFQSVTVEDDAPSISFTFMGGSRPGTTSGALGPGDSFATTYTIPGTCTETYDFDGSFTGPDSFSGTLTATFVDSSGWNIFCYDCTTQSWTVNGTR